MDYEKTIKRDDGTTIKVRVHVYIDSLIGCVYSFSISIRPYGRRKWIQRPSLARWEKDKMSLDEISQYELYLVSKDEIYQCFLECWEQMRPNKL